MTRLFVMGWEDIPSRTVYPDKFLVLSNDNTLEEREVSINYFLLDYLHEDVILTFVANADNTRMVLEAQSYGAELITYDKFKQLEG